MIGYSYGTNYLAEPLVSVETGAVSTLTQAKALVFSVVPVIGTVVDGTKLAVVEAIDTAVGAVHFDDLHTNVFVPMTQMADGLDSTQVQMIQLLGQGDALSGQITTLVGLSTLIATTLEDITTHVKALSSPPKAVPGFAGNFYALGQPIDFLLTADQISSASVSAPNASLIFNPIRMSPNLSVFADTIRQVQVTSLATATNAIGSASNSNLTLT